MHKTNSALFILLFLLLVYPFVQKEQVPHANNRKSQDSLVLLFVGDIMLDRGVELQMQTHKDWKWPFLKVASYFQQADVVFGNLESVISDQGTKVGSIYSLRADPKSIEGLVFAGFDALSVANNHSLDYTTHALQQTISLLKEKGIAPIGAGSTSQEALTPFIKEMGGVKIGVIAYTALGSPLWRAGSQNPGIAWVDDQTLPEFTEHIRNIKNQVDILAVSLHFGDEYQSNPNEFQKRISKGAIDAGADLVIGHHPHVVQPIKQYKQGWIAYSLGNFVFDQNFSKDTMQGLLLRVQVKGKKIEKVQALPISINPSFQPELEKNK